MNSTMRDVKLNVAWNEIPIDVHAKYLRNRDGTSAREFVN